MACSINQTRHGATRCAQRGLSERDVHIVEIFGVEIRDGYLLRERDAASVAAMLRHCADRVEKLAGTRLVTEAGQLITAYRAARSKQRQLLRQAHDNAVGF